MKYVSLFAGIGGFDLALDRLGHEGFWANDVDPRCKSVYDAHFRIPLDTRSIIDIPTTDIPDHDLLVAGFPCQAFSVAGRRHGFEDSRGTLFFEILRIVRDRLPTYLLLENVRGLLSHDGGHTLTVLLGALASVGYDVSYVVCNSKDFGIAQHRERIYLVGSLRGKSRPEVFDLASVGGTDRTADPRPAGINNPSRGYELRRDGLACCLRAGASGSKNLVYDGRRIRRLTPEECEQLQGFPIGWTQMLSDNQRYFVLGNAATVPVVEALASRLCG